MAEWLIGIEGTPAGRHLAMVLALAAALLHASFGALQKGRHDPWLSRAGIDAAYGLMALPVAIFLVPAPETWMWPIFAGAWVIHTVYKIVLAMAYSRGAFTVVYPVVRGTGPLFTVIGAWLLFGEVFTPLQWLGVAVLLAGIFGLAGYNLVHWQVDRATLRPALVLAVITGLFVALYTTWDAYGIRATANPFTFIAWFFVLDSLFMPLWQWRRLAGLARGEAMALARRGILGGLIGMGSFGSVMMATRLDKVGEAAVLRETSTVFAALLGWLFLKETVGPRRLGLMALIALGAVIVEFGD